MSDVAIGASGFMGIALETESGTYEEPTKFFPIRSESLDWTQNTILRRVIRGTVDPIGAVPGDGNVEGDVDMECLEDVLPYFLAIARGDLVQSGASPDFTYQFTANHSATPSRTASITVVRAGEVFGYVGCVVSSMNFTVEDGMLVMTLTILGNREEEQDEPTLVYGADQPFGSGSYIIEIPTGTPVRDTDNFTFQVEDNGEPQVRLKNELGAEFIKYGERNATVSVDRDFTDRAEYDEFKVITQRSLTLRTQKEPERFVAFHIPVTIKEDYTVGLSGVGDLVRASITYQAIHDAVIGAGYRITVGTNEDLGLGA